jgi:hypothetical protein
MYKSRIYWYLVGKGEYSASVLLCGAYFYNYLEYRAIHICKSVSICYLCRVRLCTWNHSNVLIKWLFSYICLMSTDWSLVSYVC